MRKTFNERPGRRDRRRMRLFAFWTAFSIVLLCWMGTRYIQSWDSCLKSSYVKMIVIGDEKKTIDQCQLADQIFFTTEVSAEQKKWVRKVRAVEDLWPSLKVKSKPVVIEVRESDPFFYSVNSGIISLGGQVIRSQGILEKAILESWLMQMNGQQDRYTLDVFSDVLSSMIRSSDEWQDPTTGENYRTSQNYWPEELASFNNYCLSDHKSPAHILFCADQSQPTEAGLSIWSAKSTLSSLVYEFSNQLPLKEREQFVEKISQITISSFPQSSSRAEFFGWIEKTLSSIFQNNPGLAGFFEVQKKQKGLQDQVVFPLVIHFQDEAVDPNRFSKLIEWSSRKPTKSVAISTEGRMHMLPNFNTLDINKGDWKARRILWVSCEMPTTEQILSIRAEKVTAMKVCPGDKSIDWERVMVSDIEDFLLHHEDVSYIDLHIPSLQLAVSTGLVADTKQTINYLLKLNLDTKMGYGKVQYVSHPIAFLMKFRM